AGCRLRAARDAGRLSLEGGPDHDRRVHHGRRPGGRLRHPQAARDRGVPAPGTALRGRSGTLGGAGRRAARRAHGRSGRTASFSPWKADYACRTNGFGGLMSTSTESPRQLVIFSLGNEEYALPITRVQEIIRFTEPRNVASHTAWIRGVINLRGKIVPVCDL